MTTIAVRNGQIAADSRETIEGEGGDYCRKCTKLFKLDDSRVIGLAGESGPGLLFLEWVRAEHGERKDEIREQLRSADVDFTAVMCYPDGSVFEFDKWCIPVEITAPFYACGTGSKVALGAMKAGASAAQAVLIACELDPYTAEPVTWETFCPEGVK